MVLSRLPMVLIINFMNLEFSTSDPAAPHLEGSYGPAPSFANHVDLVMWGYDLVPNKRCGFAILGE